MRVDSMSAMSTMGSGLFREARKRARLTQRGRAEEGTAPTQSAIARLESGRTQPGSTPCSGSFGSAAWTSSRAAELDDDNWIQAQELRKPHAERAPRGAPTRRSPGSRAIRDLGRHKEVAIP